MIIYFILRVLRYQPFTTCVSKGLVNNKKCIHNSQKCYREWNTNIYLTKNEMSKINTHRCMMCLCMIAVIKHFPSFMWEERLGWGKAEESSQLLTLRTT